MPGYPGAVSEATLRLIGGLASLASPRCGDPEVVLALAGRTKTCGPPAHCRRIFRL